MRREKAEDTLIVALDTDAHSALALAHSLRDKVRLLKVGMTLFYDEGPQVVRALQNMGFDVFLDLKLHDIPHQVYGAARSIASLGVKMITVHASGGSAMVEAAVRGACEGSAECEVDAPDVLAVTVLTSMDAETLAEVGVACSVEDQVKTLMSLAKGAGATGVVCSPNEAALAREVMGREALVVTPGIRPSWAASDDQARIATPAQALAAGATHLVVGRPVTAADEPALAAMRILEEMEG